MRTTLNLDDDVVAAAKALADSRGRTLGEIISMIVRESLKPKGGSRTKNGVPQLAVGKDARPVTPDLVTRLAEEDT